MTLNRVSRWTCNRCGHTEEHPAGPDEQPHRWRRLFTARPPLGEPEGRRIFHLCEDCVDGLVAFLGLDHTGLLP